jgi:hypothetical protein
MVCKTGFPCGTTTPGNFTGKLSFEFTWMTPMKIKGV